MMGRERDWLRSPRWVDAAGAFCAALYFRLALLAPGPPEPPYLIPSPPSAGERVR